ncbi:hypothetical protein FB45DRAFT_1085082 [Roridomyces roridus]|uniref:Uncharacterized protein n=1 Tax=Roridomyces roridus TaxID=1738132 RepID=A0AAD7BNL1_9AGAR|nr:hypothetical protein FB45DRAFT_1085082 [Roridomyces roridus]
MAVPFSDCTNVVPRFDVRTEKPVSRRAARRQRRIKSVDCQEKKKDVQKQTEKTIQTQTQVEKSMPPTLSTYDPEPATPPGIPFPIARVLTRSCTLPRPRPYLIVRTIPARTPPSDSGSTSPFPVRSWSDDDQPEAQPEQTWEEEMWCVVYPPYPFHLTPVLDGETYFSEYAGSVVGGIDVLTRIAPTGCEDQVGVEFHYMYAYDGDNDAGF